jgi:hypothetical protein
MNNGDGFPADRRKEARSIECAAIRFIAVEKGPEIFKGVVGNTSDDGMTLFSYVPLYVGEKVKVEGAETVIRRVRS